MKRSIKTNNIAAFTLAAFAASVAPSLSGASVLPSPQISGAMYTADFAADAARALTFGSVASLVSLATNDIAKTIAAIDVAALTRTLQPEPARWVKESVAPEQPVARATIAAPTGTAAFGTVAIPFKRLAALKKFAPSLSEMTDGTAIDCNAAQCSETTTAIKVAFAKTSQSSIRDKLNAVNVTINHTIRYSRDIDTYKVADYWATPAETLSRQQGDCEDFAILKMAALHAEGVDLKDMSVVVLFDQRRHFYHAVLSVAVNDNRFILDNMRDEVLPDTKLPDYVPLYSIADGKGYLHGTRTGAKQVASAMPLEKIAPGEGMAF
ncbi:MULTISPECIES: transglutaminase-like cysteine peptidase [unclassified Rhizobium]|uniref:transglutaminase-like cysteine peptidase n=1 Tax=unclassified Rhizobium TaxID=2613769 RepID=UPI00161ABAD7|nr:MULTISPECIES: transglutaminase-like cysteine peptidase [unclassified Rhizobium]MBB3539877.1 putative transglutaminase-like cysteine proteinase [Rhizobium sp. BK399]MCS3739114.1 putative transglutaminase-like cysteine proteinase [Rhizobium sp. BK661]MCS4090562.1 putative transglutaminase-like cysteine proteinase [Rhizobium sp. BK176]